MDRGSETQLQVGKNNYTFDIYNFDRSGTLAISVDCWLDRNNMTCSQLTLATDHERNLINHCRTLCAPNPFAKIYNVQLK